MPFYRYILVFALFFLGITSVGQEVGESRSLSQITLVIDSLENQLSQADNSQKVRLYIELAHHYLLIDKARSVEYGYRAIALKNSVDSLVEMSPVYRLLAKFYQENSASDSTLKYLQLAMISADQETKNARNQLFHGYELEKQTRKQAAEGLHQMLKPLNILLAIVLLVFGLFFLKQYMANQRLSKDFKQKETSLQKIAVEVDDFRTKVKEEVIQRTAELQQRLEKERQHEFELRKKLKQVEEADYLKNAFLGSLSHEIRTPLSGIIGFSNLLQTELAVMGNAELYEYTENIEQSSLQLTGLLDNIIDISSIEANMVEVELQFDHFNNIVKDVKAIFQKKAKDKGLVFKVKIDTELPKLKADSIKLKKVLNILTDNAIKYSTTGFVTITSAYNPEKNVAVIQVKDTGDGIDPDTLKALLASFQYGKKGKTQIYQGKGIGLTLAHRFVNMMGGSISISSQLQKGTVVTIAIPCVGGQSQAETASEITETGSLIAAPELGEISLFIVEDDRMNRLVLEKMLKKAGKITMAIDGDDALSKVENAYNQGEIFRVMLFDMQLPPPWDGTSLMKAIKERLPEYKSVPFIVQTAFAMSGDRDSYLAAGFDDYIAKPINRTELLTMIQKHLHLAQA